MTALSVSSFFGFIDSNVPIGKVPWGAVILDLVGLTCLCFFTRIPKKIVIKNDSISFYAPGRSISLSPQEIEKIDDLVGDNEADIIGYIIYNGGKKLYLHKKYKNFDRILEYLKEKNDKIVFTSEDDN